MVAGYDTYHDSSRKGRSAGAFVASTNEHMSQWYSKVNFHSAREEMSSHLSQNVVLSMKNWLTLNKSPPKHLVIYRDGVGEGNLDYVHSHEVSQVREALTNLVPGGGDIKLIFVIVSKRVNARFFLKRDEEIRNLDNCPPGTVVDKLVTRPGRKDFYLIPQGVREGTITPTMYDAIHDEVNIPIAALQSLTYALTHLYYNWQVCQKHWQLQIWSNYITFQGAVKVPAPCQYAHKLAFISGQSLHEEYDPRLSNNLWYL